jgi:hypothetical protein
MQDAQSFLPVFEEGHAEAESKPGSGQTPYSGFSASCQLIDS